MIFPVTGCDRISYVGHSTVLVELSGARLLTDPVLGRRVGPLIRHGPMPGPATTENLDAVLVSHLHRDHADRASLRRIDRATPFLVPAGSLRFFQREGFTAITELAPGAAAQVGPVTVRAVEARHGGGGRRLAKGSEAIGFLVESRRRIYFAGDTDLFPGMGEIGPGLDLALLPVWGWGPSVGPGHLDPERAARAVALLQPRIAVPIHWGTLYPLGLARLRPSPLRSPAPAFAESVRRLAPQVEVRSLEPGAALVLA